MVVIRDATENDVEAIRDLFVRVYGEDYPFPGFYDTHWLKKSVFDDDTLFMIAEVDDAIVATASVMLDAGGLTDLIGELGRLVAESTKRARGAASQLIEKLLERIDGKVHFAFGEVRTVHRGSQRLAESFGWRVVGFEPLKYQFGKRESVLFYASLQSDLAREMRRNNPRVIPEVALLAKSALQTLGLPDDVIVEDETDGYPTCTGCDVDRLKEIGVSPLLRIERGRVSNREIFGHFSLSHGFFRISDSNSHYLVARQGDALTGAVGFTHDPIDDKIRIFELIEFDDAVKGHLLASVDRIAREEFAVKYMEVDVSAYSPKIQRTFERLGFIPVAYCPSMVFDNVERLDVVRMAKVCVRYDPGQMRLMKTGQEMQDIVEHGLEDRLLGMEITEANRKVDIFRGLPDGDLYHLARISLMKTHPAGEQLIRMGDETDRIYIIVEGTAEARHGPHVLGSLGPGKIVGEMGLVERDSRSADVWITEEARIIEIQIPRLERLMQQHPRIGYAVTRNIARGLSEKLRSRNEDG